MYFKNEEHRKVYNELLQEKDWSKWAIAAFYVLSAMGKDVKKYVHPDLVDFPELFKVSEVWSSGEQSLVKLAADLFCPGVWPATVHEVFHSLDEENTQIAIEALKSKYL